MGKLVRMAASEYLKVQRSWLLGIHIIMPVLGIIIFLWYFSISGWDEWGKISGYLQTVSIICPTMAGIVCALSAEQEKQASHMQNLLGLTKTRWVNMGGKLIILLIGNLLAVLLTVAGFGLGFRLLISEVGFTGQDYIMMAGVIWLPQIFSYLFHLYLGLRFSKGVTIGVGIVESLVAALMITGLGAGLWQWAPCGWAGHFAGYYMMLARGSGNADLIKADLGMGAACMGIYTIIAFILFTIWLNRYEGSDIED